MYIILLKFSDNKSLAPEFMAGHKKWIQSGLDEETFLLVASLQPGESLSGGGCILAQNITLEKLQQKLNDDPFVAEYIVRPEIIDISPNQAIEQLSFLLKHSENQEVRKAI